MIRACQLSMLFAWLALVGCTGTRIGNPGTNDGGQPPTFDSLDFDPDKVFATDTADGVRIEGEPGAAPPDTDVRAAPLEGAESYESAETEDDGSFVVLVPDNAGARSTTFLVQAYRTDAFSQASFVSTAFLPSDLTCIEGPPVQLANAVSSGVTLDLVFENGCPFEQAMRILLHPLSSGVALETEMDIAVAAQSSSSIQLSVNAPAQTAFEGHVVVFAGQQTLIASVVGSVE